MLLSLISVVFVLLVGEFSANVFLPLISMDLVLGTKFCSGMHEFIVQDSLSLPEIIIISMFPYKWLFG